MADKSSRKNPFDTAAAKYLSQQPGAEPETRPPPPRPEAPPLTKAERETRRIRERRARRATYDLPPLVRRKIEALSIEYGVPQSQIVAYLLIEGAQRLHSGEIDLTALRTKSTSPKFAYNLQLDEALARLKKLG